MGIKPGIIFIEQDKIDTKFIDFILLRHFNFELAKEPSLNIKVQFFIKFMINSLCYLIYMMIEDFMLIAYKFNSFIKYLDNGWFAIKIVLRNTKIHNLQQHKAAKNRIKICLREFMTKQLAINLKIFSDKQIYFHMQNGVKIK